MSFYRKLSLLFITLLQTTAHFSSICLWFVLNHIPLLNRYIISEHNTQHHHSKSTPSKSVHYSSIQWIKQHFTLLISFDGTQFDGYAKATDIPRSVEAALQEVLFKTSHLGRRPDSRLKDCRWSRALCLGPKSSALGQVISLELDVASHLLTPEPECRLQPSEFIERFNTAAPPSIRLLCAVQTPPEFRAAKAARRYIFDYLVPCGLFDVILEDDHTSGLQDQLSSISWEQGYNKDGQNAQATVSMDGDRTTLDGSETGQLCDEIRHAGSTSGSDLCRQSESSSNERRPHSKKIRRFRLDSKKIRQTLQLFEGSFDHRGILGNSLSAEEECKELTRKLAARDVCSSNSVILPGGHKGDSATGEYSDSQRKRKPLMRTVDWTGCTTIRIPQNGPTTTTSKAADEHTEGSLYRSWANDDEESVEEFIQLSICSDVYSDYHIRKIIGLALAASTGLISPSAITVLLRYAEISQSDPSTDSPSFPIIPTAPGDGLILRSVVFEPHLKPIVIDENGKEASSPIQTVGQISLRKMIKRMSPVEGFFSLFNLPQINEVAASPRKDGTSPYVSDPHLLEWLTDKEGLSLASNNRLDQLPSSLRRQCLPTSNAQVARDFEDQLIRQIALTEIKDKALEHWLCSVHQTMPNVNKPRDHFSYLQQQSQLHTSDRDGPTSVLWSLTTPMATDMDTTRARVLYSDSVTSIPNLEISQPPMSTPSEVSNPLCEQSVDVTAEDKAAMPNVKFSLNVSDLSTSPASDGRLMTARTIPSDSDRQLIDNSPCVYRLDTPDEIDVTDLEVFNIASPHHDGASSCSYSDDNVDHQNIESDSDQLDNRSGVHRPTHGSCRHHCHTTRRASLASTVHQGSSFQLPSSPPSMRLQQLELLYLKLFGWSSIIMNSTQLLTKLQQRDLTTTAATSTTQPLDSHPS